MLWRTCAILTVAALIAFATTQQSAHAFDPLLGPDFQLDESDIALLKAASQRLYMTDSAQVGAIEAWNNPETGNQGTVTLVKKHEYKGMPCRGLQHDITLKRSKDLHRYILDRCKTANGEWKILAR